MQIINNSSTYLAIVLEVKKHLRCNEPIKSKFRGQGVGGGRSGFNYSPRVFWSRGRWRPCGLGHQQATYQGVALQINELSILPKT